MFAVSQGLAFVPSSFTSRMSSSVRVTGGNFRLLYRRLTRMERILEINQLPRVTQAMVEAARKSLVIGQL